MDGDGGGMPGGMNDVGTRNVDGDVTEGEDGDSASSVLHSMGYLNGGSGTGGRAGESTRSVASVLKTALIVAVVLFFGVTFLYFLISGVLALVGVQL